MPRLKRQTSTRELVQGWHVAIDDYPTALAFSRTGDRVAIGTGAGQLVVLDSGSGAEIWRRDAHPGGVLAVSFGPHAIASGGQDGRARITSVDGHVLHGLPANDARGTWVEHVAWSPDGARLATAAGKIVRLWHADGTPFLQTHPHASTVTALQWSRTGTEVATTCYGGAYLWTVESGANPRVLAFKGSLISLAWSPDDEVVACGSQDCSVHFWRLGTGRDSEMSGYPFKPKALAWDAGSSMLATGGDAAVCVWSFRGRGPEGTTPMQLASHRAQVTALGFHPRKGLLASLAQDMGLIVWEPRNGAEPFAFGFLDDTPEALAWHPQQACVVTTDVSGGIRAWNVAV